MVFKKDGGDITLGTDTWNVADGYTKLKILKLIVVLDRWEMIAQFGTEEIDEDNLYNGNQIRKRRVEGLERLHFTIKQLLSNVLFSMKKDDVDKIKAMITRVDNAGEYIPKCFEEKEDLISNNYSFEIKETTFKSILSILSDVKEKLNTPLNNAGLIFRASEEVDLDKIMKGIIDGG